MHARTARRPGAGLGSVVAAAGLLAALVMGPGAGTGAAMEIPPSGGFYIQTSGANTPVTIGDWYTSTSAGAGAGYHYVTITVPCGWPSGTPLYIDLFSPEMNAVGALSLSDEPRNSSDPAEFELYGPGATIGPGYDHPLPGTGTLATTYPPEPVLPEAWVRFATLSPVTCGSYLIRSALLGQSDDDNGWRIRVGTDNDGNPNNAPPANADDPDGQPGTNDEIIIGQVQITYQQSTGGVACLTLYEFVPALQASTMFHNFDMDGNTRVRYYAPSDVYDPTGLSGGTVGTLSSNGAWNGGTIARGGDSVPNPEAGWWRIVSCLSSNNQFIQEAQDGVGAYFSQPPTPSLSISKTDGTAVAPAGGDLTYVTTVTNTSSGPTAGAANSVVVTDTIPTNSTFQGCQVVAPATGSCSQSAGVVTATLNGWINAGDSVEVQITVTVDPAATGTVSNGAGVTFEDVLGNQFPEVTASDVDSVGPPLPTPTPTLSPTPTATPTATPTPTPNPMVPDTSASGIRDEPNAPSDVGALLAILLVALLGMAWQVTRRGWPSLPRWFR